MLNMLRRIGVDADVVTTPEGLDRVTKMILPGIGAFDNGIAALRGLGLDEPIRARVAQGTPILGVCLGMQLLGRASAEGALPGLGLIDAACRRLPSDTLRVPHMGWNTVSQHRANPILDGLEEGARFYFVHSYHVVCADPGDVLATTDYGGPFTSMVHRDHVWGAQFHPEKSHRYGMTLLANFARLS
jgi:glutamine amidotransferase